MKIYIIDGNAYIYRFFHALKGLSNSRGMPTNAIFGFVGMLFKLIYELKAQAIVAVFDSKEPTERHNYYPQYKANRPSMPDELVVQVPVIKSLLKTLSIKTIEIPSIEADDIIGSIACKFAESNHEVFIMSGDKDFLQLVSDKVSIYDFHKEKVLDLKFVIDKFGIEPKKIADIMALTGDSIDNIPGVKGIGEKKAIELIKEFHDIENLIENYESIKNERIRRLIRDSIEDIRLSKRLSLINCNIAIDINLDDITIGNPNYDELKALINEYELKSFIKYLPKDDTKSINFYILQNNKELESYLIGKTNNIGVS
ncbi:MAG: hypothetical protein N2738_06755 [Thermodesulfovibrionales bacterium]|nr:hypothetical protein [Thermodesulfovibrionales bacterium]